MSSSFPQLGAQIWIEPETTRGDIDHWMQLLASHRMPVARIWVLWRLIEPKHGAWDFALYDEVFDSAAQHGIKLLVTLTPEAGPAHRGFTKILQPSRVLDSPSLLDQACEYVTQVASRYASHPALDTWILVNEPGERARQDELTEEGFRSWLLAHYESIEALNRAWNASFVDFKEIRLDPELVTHSWSPTRFYVDWQLFWQDHLAGQLRLWAEIVRLHDPKHALHVNPHALIGNLSVMGINMPAWRGFLDSLGGSIHPSWHFWMLRADQYPMGVAYVSDLLLGASEPHPFWVTELQGGNNIHSGIRPLCPDAQDIAQWVWSGIGSGAQRVVFWLLNMRTQGYEGGEWSMLDFQGRATDRLAVSGEIAAVIERHADLFAGAKPLPSSVTIILSLETMLLQDRFHAGEGPARDRNAHVLEALGFYETLMELGLPVRIKFIHDFPWESAFDTPQLIILPHLSAVSMDQAAAIHAFAAKGHQVLATGLTGFYDHYGIIWPARRFPMQDLLGGTFREVRYLRSPHVVSLCEASVALPCPAFRGELEPAGGQTIAEENGRILALRNHCGSGSSTWIPSLIGLGAWTGDRHPLAEFLSCLLAGAEARCPFRFARHQPGLLLRVLERPPGYVTVLINGSSESVTAALIHPEDLDPSVLWGEPAHLPAGGTIRLGGKETIVLSWTKKT